MDRHQIRLKTIVDDMIAPVVDPARDLPAASGRSRFTVGALTPAPSR